MKKISVMALIIICCFVSFANSQSRQKKAKSGRAGLPYVIAYNYIDPKISPDDEERRFIEVLIKPHYFTKEKLTSLFQIISKRFPAPDTLFVNVYTDKKDILTPKERAEGYLIDIDEQGNETQVRPSLEGRSNQKPTAIYTRSKGSLNFIMIMDEQIEEVEMNNTAQNKK